MRRRPAHAGGVLEFTEVTNRIAWFCAALGTLAVALAQKPESVLIVSNDSSALSRSVAEYYSRKRGIPVRNVCRIHVPVTDEISRADYERSIAQPIAACLSRGKLHESILYIVTTAGVPLRIPGTSGLGGSVAAVDSELTLLYSDMLGRAHGTNGYVRNPFFDRTDRPKFQHPEFPIYLVTRLDGYDFADIRGLIDRALMAKNRGKFVFDLKEGPEVEGDDWLARAAQRLPADRVILENSSRVLYDEADVIGYGSWGSNDKNRRRRLLNFRWLPGAIMTEYVSTDARTFKRPPDSWTFGNWGDKKTWFAESPQSMIGDYIHEGVTGVSGHVAEPYLGFNPRPEILFPAYFRGRNLAESYYLSIPGLSWQNIVVGDPLCVVQP